MRICLSRAGFRGAILRQFGFAVFLVRALAGPRTTCGDLYVGSARGLVRDQSAITGPSSARTHCSCRGGLVHVLREDATIPHRGRSTRREANASVLDPVSNSSCGTLSLLRVARQVMPDRP
jgi:hypothetical protein